jgi:hypothetical protein
MMVENYYVSLRQTRPMFVRRACSGLLSVAISIGCSLVHPSRLPLSVSCLITTPPSFVMPKGPPYIADRRPPPPPGTEDAQDKGLEKANTYPRSAPFEPCSPPGPIVRRPRRKHAGHPALGCVRGPLPPVRQPQWCSRARSHRAR